MKTLKHGIALKNPKHDNSLEKQIMIKSKTNMLRRLYTVSDAIIVFFSYYFAEWFWLEVIAKNGNFLQNDSLRGYVLMAVSAYAALIVVLFTLTGIYSSFRYKNIWRIWLKCSIIHTLLVGCIIIALYFFRIQDVSRGTLGVFLITILLITLLKHAVAVGLLRLVRYVGFNQKHVILVGSGELAHEYISTVDSNRRYGITIDGYIAHEPCDESGTYLGDFSCLEQLLAGSGVDEVVIALNSDEMDVVGSVIKCCEKCGTRVNVIPFFNNMISDRPSISTVGNLKCIELRSSPLDDLLNRTLKRTFDIVFSLFVLVLVSPIMLITSLLIKITSRGPVLFKQIRVGKNKKEFKMYKFRSMKVNSESTTAWSRNSDSRRTAIGSFIRKTSIDELPQFFNVLKGDMSVIGPRPEIPFFVEQFKEEIPQYMLKHLVRPGITGWAQVNGYRGDTSIEERIKCDIWYIENWSPALDVNILFRTVFGGMINSEKIK